MWEYVIILNDFKWGKEREKGGKEEKKGEGKKVGDAELSSDVYGIEPNIPVVHQVVVCQDASARQGTHSTLAWNPLS